MTFDDCVNDIPQEIQQQQYHIAYLNMKINNLNNTIQEITQNNSILQSKVKNLSKNNSILQTNNQDLQNTNNNLLVINTNLTNKNTFLTKEIKSIKRDFMRRINSINESKVDRYFTEAHLDLMYKRLDCLSI